ncbi:hypothetical protein BDP81DRAFT_182506 [Colletotrichum phormii]|uniref:Uncharacterized protein n=1 Tax=Colletotrichum phormii TaxID=359342 RepID=A0AAI9ZZK2_9PEZI|nr:uncharacterized protein BDP81DRAFT_182506 [Colletotrichum phormii]KAK1639734.1 hypothetical protein BDP81DRAFT_182506 [Colletotrichum phormii]
MKIVEKLTMEAARNWTYNEALFTVRSSRTTQAKFGREVGYFLGLTMLRVLFVPLGKERPVRKGMLAGCPLAWRFFPAGGGRPADVPPSNLSYPPCMRLQLRLLLPGEVSCLTCSQVLSGSSKHGKVGSRKGEERESKVLCKVRQGTLCQGWL